MNHSFEKKKKIKKILADRQANPLEVQRGATMEIGTEW